MANVKVKTDTLDGPALDYAVAIALGYKERIRLFTDSYAKPPVKRVLLTATRNSYGTFYTNRFEPSSAFSEAAWILDKANIYTSPDGNIGAGFTAAKWLPAPELSFHEITHTVIGAPSRTVAGLRCFVWCELGDEVDVPSELL